jgi:hypothetical protein
MLLALHQGLILTLTLLHSWCTNVFTRLHRLLFEKKIKLFDQFGAKYSFGSYLD